ncbi:sugar-transfer associated ATP-grasp domain-containing protein [Butyricimonas synergistica]|uniref:sugar-transfer associated ATP-grasp domain-containing protein n=1 Tax=Butyricimonas synergistica TaxID=544644 RepID=UPI0022E1158A|nr:sugar-transfer associated ATP-grasp domain-containing protein [Butyricimonas synergistica]
MRERIKRFLYYYFNIRNRAKWVRGDLRMKLSINNFDLVRQSDIGTYWSRFRGKYDPRWFDLYNSINQGRYDLKYYIPDDFYYCYIDAFFAERKKCLIYDNKNMYDLYFHDVKQPRTIVKNIDGVFVNNKYEIVDLREARKMCLEEGRVIIKPSVNSEGGKGISFFDRDDDANVLDKLLSRRDIIVQEVIQQHDSLAKIHSSSINTIRIMTLVFDNRVHVLSSVLRMGVNNAQVDNASSGGIVCGIQMTGQLKSVAYDIKVNKYERHPQGGKFEDIIVPNLNNCYELVKRLALRFVGMTKLISWDFAIGVDGEPILIEANLSFGQIDFHQLCNGPIFKEMTDEILCYVARNNILLNRKL